MNAVMKKMVYVLILYVLFLSPSFSQVDSLESFFPLQIGNFWQYYVTHIVSNDTSYYYDYVSVLGDTILGNENNIYYLVKTPVFAYIAIDSIAFLRFDTELRSIVSFDLGEEAILFKLDADVNDCWEYYGTEVCCREIGILNVFGEDGSYKNFEQDNGPPPWNYSLAKDFGPVEMYLDQTYIFIEDFLYNLVYAKINGVEYGVLAVDDNANSINDFQLYQNYPNPFNPTTTITYQIPQTEFITLKVYDILGREVATLVNEEKPAGSYEVQFTGNGLTSGIYFYQLKVGVFTEAKKMILLR